MSAHLEQRNQEATVYCRNLDDRIQEELLWELMVQVGPVVSVHLPKDRVTGQTQGYGFVEFRTEQSAEYCVNVMNMIKIFDKPIRINKANQGQKMRDVGANLFIGNLDPDVDEKLLYDTFSAFGSINNTPKVMRDLDTGNSKGFGFVNFDSFEAADLAIECMNGQFLANRSITCQYAFKKDSKGERHGSQAERLLAANHPQRLKPNTLFASEARPRLGNAPGTAPAAPGTAGMPPLPPMPPNADSGHSNMMPPMPPPPPGFNPNMMPPMPPRAPAPPRPQFGAPTLPTDLHTHPPAPPQVGFGSMIMPPGPPRAPPSLHSQHQHPPHPPMGMMRPHPNMGMGMPPHPNMNMNMNMGMGPPPMMPPPPRHMQMPYGMPPRGYTPHPQ